MDLENQLMEGMPCSHKILFTLLVLPEINVAISVFFLHDSNPAFHILLPNLEIPDPNNNVILLKLSFGHWNLGFAKSVQIVCSCTLGES